MEEIPSNAVIYTKLEDFINQYAIDCKQNKEDHASIIVQTTKTNGSVAKLQSWQSFLKGGLAVLTILVIPVVLMVVREWITKKPV